MLPRQRGGPGADGDVIAAAQEERFSRKKADSSFPALALASCLRDASITSKDVDNVGFYDKPLLKFERLLETYLAFSGDQNGVAARK